MISKTQLFQNILEKQSFLCIGLDTDLKKIPPHLLETEDPVFEFNKAIIEATQDLCVAYKPNLAFYECLGPKGWLSLEKTLKIIPENIFTIADAKRADIGNTSNYYAQTFFEYLNFDALTLAPYMGSDSIVPFLKYPGKWSILLALTSNEGGKDFQLMPLQNKKYLFEEVLEVSKTWGTEENLMYVVGATKKEWIAQIRQIVPEHFLLVPGVGAQGGSLKDVCEVGLNKSCGLLVNSSRGIIYASNKEDFAEAARAEAQKIADEMKSLLHTAGLV